MTTAHGYVVVTARPIEWLAGTGFSYELIKNALDHEDFQQRLAEVSQFGMPVGTKLLHPVRVSARRCGAA